MFNIDEIDAGIIDWVLFLRKNGFETISSCEGCGYDGTTHFEMPQVIIRNDNETISNTIQRLRELCGVKPIISMIGGSSEFPTSVRFVPPYEITISKPNCV